MLFKQAHLLHWFSNSLSRRPDTCAKPDTVKGAKGGYPVGQVSRVGSNVNKAANISVK